MPPREAAPVRKVVQISTMVHAEKDWAFISPAYGISFLRTGRLDVPDFLHEIAESDRRFLEWTSEVVDLRHRPSPSLVFVLID